MLIKIKPFNKSQQSEVIKLWTDCGLVAPQNNPLEDIRRKSKVNPELFLVALSGKKLIGTVMAGYEGHRGWINYLAVDPTQRKLGLGRQLMAEAEKRLKKMGCPKINLQIRESNAEVRAFYERIGFTQDKAVSYGKRLAQDAKTGKR
jgi:ribosomal protein S18 acetylase RimI-like enzyme